MNRNRVLLFATNLITALVLAPATQAQATHTWVSGVGDDNNTCTRTAPCRTFAGAISKTAAGGEILVLDHGSYGTVTITTAITINGAGQLADIQAATGSNGITINAGVNDKVILRNLSINGAGTGLNGVRYLAGKQVVLENVTIDGFTSRGVDVALSGNGRLEMSNISITNAATGVRLFTTAGAVTANLEDIRLNSLTTGLEAASVSTFATLRNSVVTSCGTALLANANTSVINAEDSTLSVESRIVPWPSFRGLSWRFGVGSGQSRIRPVAVESGTDSGVGGADYSAFCLTLALAIHLLRPTRTFLKRSAGRLW